MCIFSDLIFLSFSTLVPVRCPLLHRQGVSHSFRDVFPAMVHSHFGFDREENPNIFLVDFISVTFVSSTVHSENWTDNLQCPPPPRGHVQNSFLYFSLNKQLSLLCLWAAASFESGHGFWYAVCKHTTSQN